MLNYRKLNILLCLFAVFVFGGCEGYLFNDDIIQPGTYYVRYGANFNYPSLNIATNNYLSNIEIHYFRASGYDYKISFSGNLHWTNRYGIIVRSERISRITARLIETDYYTFKTKYYSDPYIYIELYDNGLDIYTKDFMVGL